MGDRLEDLVDCCYGLGYEILRDKGYALFRGPKEVVDAVPAGGMINLICVHPSGAGASL